MNGHFEQQAWTTVGSRESPARVFISYVREDQSDVDRIQSAIEAAGIEVWRDVKDHWPGEDWKLRIGKGISDGALTVVACFSDRSAAGDYMHQHEELDLTIRQLRKRPPDRRWFIPVRLSNCALPPYEIGAGRTLDSLRRIDLFDEHWDGGIARLVAGVVRSFPDTAIAREVTPQPFIEPLPDAESRSQPLRATSSTVATVKETILRPERRIELHDLIVREVRGIHDALADPNRFPADQACVTEDVAGLRFLVQQSHQYEAVLAPIIPVLVAFAAWRDTDEQSKLLGEAVERIANVTNQWEGKTALVAMRRYPALIATYACGLAAVRRENYESLRAVIEARFREMNRTVPLIAAINPSQVFGTANVVAQVLALESAEERNATDDELSALLRGQGPRSHAPVSDHLCALLRPHLDDLVPDDETYTETFDRLEVLLAAAAEDAAIQLGNSEPKYFAPGAWIGSWAWRSPWGTTPEDDLVHRDLRYAGVAWPPLGGGLCGGSLERAERALESVVEQSQRVRTQSW
jgi:TIR domain